MSNQPSFSDYSAGPSGQGCLWIVAVGIVILLAMTSLSAYTGSADPLTDGAERTLSPSPAPRARVSAKYHYHRRHHRSYSALSE